ncbi:hypothetical protein [Rhodovulum marinum]|uniref:Uncharacterized protein n=1 Tax=Rhodovulum marinum TaxID=320662 RepID=A0A4R2Q573_9RHOB|nr:hypothetical protein [Rhodovulum marinum]TCP41825.1 hypothetical protein EV662_104169 [Rhodovulum marinum]
MDPAWSAILARITPARPEDIDDLILDGHPPRPRGKMLAPAGQVPPSAALWARDAQDETLSRIGIRITRPLADPARAALRLAAVAVERRVIPVILSRLDASGFERLGFRVERVPPDDEAAALATEAELKKFWNLAIIVDGRDIDILG